MTWSEFDCVLYQKSATKRHAAVFGDLLCFFYIAGCLACQRGGSPLQSAGTAPQPFCRQLIHAYTCILDRHFGHTKSTRAWIAAFTGVIRIPTIISAECDIWCGHDSPRSIPDRGKGPSHARTPTDALHLNPSVPGSAELTLSLPLYPPGVSATTRRQTTRRQDDLLALYILYNFRFTIASEADAAPSSPSPIPPQTPPRGSLISCP